MDDHEEGEIVNESSLMNESNIINEPSVISESSVINESNVISGKQLASPTKLSFKLKPKSNSMIVSNLENRSECRSPTLSPSKKPKVRVTMTTVSTRSPSDWFNGDSCFSDDYKVYSYPRSPPGGAHRPLSRHRPSSPPPSRHRPSPDGHRSPGFKRFHSYQDSGHRYSDLNRDCRKSDLRSDCRQSDLKSDRRQARHHYPNDTILPPDQDPRATRTLYLGSLDPQVTESDLRALFEPFGRLRGVFTKSVPADRPTTFGFVTFENVLEAHCARSLLHGTTIGSFTCYIGYGKQAPTSRIWMGNLDQTLDTGILVKESDRFGLISKLVHLKREGEASIQFESISAAEEAKDYFRGRKLFSSQLNHLGLVTDFDDPEPLGHTLGTTENNDTVALGSDCSTSNDGNGTFGENGSSIGENGTFGGNGTSNYVFGADDNGGVDTLTGIDTLTGVDDNNNDNRKNSHLISIKDDDFVNSDRFQSSSPSVSESSGHTGTIDSYKSTSESGHRSLCDDRRSFSANGARSLPAEDDRRSLSNSCRSLPIGGPRTPPLESCPRTPASECPRSPSSDGHRSPSFESIKSGTQFTRPDRDGYNERSTVSGTRVYYNGHGPSSHNRPATQAPSAGRSSPVYRSGKSSFSYNLYKKSFENCHSRSPSLGHGSGHAGSRSPLSPIMSSRSRAGSMTSSRRGSRSPNFQSRSPNFQSRSPSYQSRSPRLEKSYRSRSPPVSRINRNKCHGRSKSPPLVPPPSLYRNRCPSPFRSQFGHDFNRYRFKPSTLSPSSDGGRYNSPKYNNLHY